MEEKFLYSISDVANILGESIPLVRNWSNKFAKFLVLFRNTKGNRFYYQDDVDLLKEVHFLVRHEKMSLSGAYDVIKDKRSVVSAKVKAVNILKSIKKQLEEIVDDIDNDKYE